MEVRSLERAEPFVTKDGSTIRELLGPEAAEAAINKAPPAAEPDRARQRQLNGEAPDQ